MVSIFESLVTPSTSRATSGPKCASISSIRGKGIFDRIVQQRGDDRCNVQLQIGHQPGDFDRVAEIGIAAGALLGAVLLHGIDIGTVEHRLVGARVVIEDLLDEFVLAEHRHEYVRRTRAGQGLSPLSRAR